MREQGWGVMYGCGGDFCCSTPQYGWGHGKDTRDTHTHTGTHTGTYTQMLHLPFSDLPLKNCRSFKGQHDQGQHDPQLWEENGTLRGSLRGPLKNLWKPLKTSETSKNLSNPLKTSKTSENLWNTPFQRSSQRPSQRQIPLRTSQPCCP